MDDLQEKRCRCKLCGAIFKDSDMSEEHYPARSTGNDDIVALDVIKMFESLRSPKVHSEIVIPFWGNMINRIYGSSIWMEIQRP